MSFPLRLIGIWNFPLDIFPRTSCPRTFPLPGQFSVLHGVGHFPIPITTMRQSIVIAVTIRNMGCVSFLKILSLMGGEGPASSVG